MLIHTLFVIGGVVLMAMSVVPFLRLPHGIIRGPEFVRLQLLAIGLLALILAVFALDGTALMIAIATFSAVAVINLIFVLKFTPLWPKQSVTADATLQTQTDRHITVLTANVKLSNRDYQTTIDLALEERPDILALIETDQGWVDAMGPVRDAYAYHVEHPLDTGYGLAVYSNFTLTDTQIRNLVIDGVPSVTTTVTLPCGDTIALYIIHPEPPTPQDPTKGRDSEIAAAGLEAARGSLPCIIAGDLNDVAWSHTTRRFQRITGLLDPRVGRGFFNTFSAFYPFFRWPLDHLFHDPHFRLVDMRRLRKIGSDHFPIQFTLALAESPKGDVPDESEEDKKTVTDMIADEKRSDRDPIGTDWEDDAET